MVISRDSHGCCGAASQESVVRARRSDGQAHIVSDEYENNYQRIDDI